MAEEVLVDALPYYDGGYDEPGVRQAALALVEEECRRYRPTKNYLDVLGPLTLDAFQTDLMKKEVERLESGVPMEMLSMKRYELPTPSGAKLAEVAAWNECVENSYAQLEHQACRVLNLEVMADYGSTSWRVYNETLQKMFEESQNQLTKIKKDIQEVNLQRKNEQTYAGERLRTLEQNWVGLVSRNYEIECAIVELEKELIDLKRQKQQQQQLNAELLQATEVENTQQQQIQNEEITNGNNNNHNENNTSDESN